jgi:hypothetical protein
MQISAERFNGSNGNPGYRCPFDVVAINTSFPLTSLTGCSLAAGTNNTWQIS